MDFHASSTLLELPFTYWELRESARNGYTLQDRRFYWPHVVTFEPKARVAALENLTAAAQRAYDRVSTLSVGAQQTQAQTQGLGTGEKLGGGMQEAAVQVMRAVSAHFPISQPGLLEPLVRHVSRVLDNTAMTFYFFCGYLKKSYWYSIPSLTAHRYKLNTFRELAMRCMKNTHALLKQLGALEERHLNLIFVDRLAELLPEKYFYRVLDMYFIEGYKILYRFGLAILKVYKARIKSGEFKTGDSFWDTVKSDAKRPDYDLFTPMFNFAFDNRRNNFFKISIVPGRGRLQAFEAATRSVMTQEELTAPLEQELVSSVAAHQHNRQVVDTSVLLHHSSRILDRNTAECLHSYLLPAAQMEGFDLVFSTYDDGWNLQTLYNKTQHLSPCILLIKTIDQGDGSGSSGGGEDAVLGMFMSTPVSPPSGCIRGDGLCFCFRLDGEADGGGQCYRWVGQTRDSVQALHSTQLQFAMCASDYMAFGGSARCGTNALRLSADLMTCDTGESDTYCNPPLVVRQGLGGGGLKVGDVEVFCGKMSQVWRR